MNTGTPIELMTTVEYACGIPVPNKGKVYLEGLEVVAVLIRKDRTDARKHGFESLIFPSDAMRICPQISDMAIRAIL